MHTSKVPERTVSIFVYITHVQFEEVLVQHFHLILKSLQNLKQVRDLYYFKVPIPTKRERKGDNA